MRVVPRCCRIRWDMPASRLFFEKEFFCIVRNVASLSPQYSRCIVILEPERPGEERALSMKRRSDGQKQ